MFENPVTLLRRLPKTVQLLVCGTLVNRLGSFIIPYLTLVLKREFDLPGDTVGLFVSAYAGGSIVSILTGGALTDRLGRRRTLLISTLGAGLIAIAMGSTSSVRVFLPLLVLFGFVADLYRPAASSIIGDVLASADRAVGFGALRLANNLGFACGMGLGGVLADLSWRAMCVADGTTTLIFSAIVYFFIEETAPAVHAPVGSAANGPSQAPWRDPVFLSLAGASLLFCMQIFIDLTVLPLTITISAGYPSVVYGLTVGANGLMIAALELPIVNALKRGRRLRIAAFGVLLSGVGFGLTGLVMHWAWFLFTVVLWTAGEILVVPQQNAFIADWAPPSMRGRYIGLYQATWSVGFALAPLLFLPLHARLSEAAFWPLLLLLSVPSAAILLHLDRTADRPELLRGANAGPPPLPVIPPALSSEVEG
jgi:MFS family permease